MRVRLIDVGGLLGGGNALQQGLHHVGIACSRGHVQRVPARIPAAASAAHPSHDMLVLGFCHPEGDQMSEIEAFTQSQSWPIGIMPMAELLDRE